MVAKSPNPVDVHVGMQLKQKRSILGMSQEQLAEKLGITFQQIQKYETGKNRVAASRLWNIACLFDVPVDYFFEGLQQGILPSESDRATVNSKELTRLINYYGRIADNDKRQSIIQMMGVMAK